MFDKTKDALHRSCVDRLAALTVPKNGFGYYVPPLGGGETAFVNLLPIILPQEMFVASTPFDSRRAIAELLSGDQPARFDWAIKDGTFWSFHDPRHAVTHAIVDLDQIDAIETAMLAFHEDIDEQNNFAFLLRQTLQHQMQDDLAWDKENRLFYFRALEAALRSGPQLVDELLDRGVRTKLRLFKDGRQIGGVPFTLGPLSHLLNNPVYVGEVRHKGTNYPGQHEPIISQELWDKVQSSLASNRVNRRIGGWGKAPSLLTGMLFDQAGRLMTPTAAAKGARRYRYYVSRAEKGEKLAAMDKVRVPAGELELAVIEQMVSWLERGAGTNVEGTSEQIDEQHLASKIFIKRLTARAFHEQREELLSRNARVDLTSDGLRIGFDEKDSAGSQSRACLEIESKLVDRGSNLKLVVGPDAGAQYRESDAVLVKLIVHAFAARHALVSGKHDTITSAYSALHRNRLARLSYLAPDIIGAIVAGNHPPSLNGRRLLRAANLPLDWDGQRLLLGFA